MLQIPTYIPVEESLKSAEKLEEHRGDTPKLL